MEEDDPKKVFRSSDQAIVWSRNLPLGALVRVRHRLVSNLKKSQVSFLIYFSIIPVLTHLYRSQPNVLSLFIKCLALFQWKRDIGAEGRT